MSALDKRGPVTPASALNAAQVRLDEEIANLNSDTEYHERQLAANRAKMAELQEQRAVIVEFIARTLAPAEVRS